MKVIQKNRCSLEGHYLEDKLNKFSELLWDEYLCSNNDSVYFVGLEDSTFLRTVVMLH